MKSLRPFLVPVFGVVLTVSAHSAPMPSSSPAKPDRPANAGVQEIPSAELSYPFLAWVLGQEGVVQVCLTISDEGKVTESKVCKSSGFPLLDNTALEATKSMRFLPALRDGKPVACQVIKPIRFELAKATPPMPTKDDKKAKSGEP
jgi:protein TonB